jgi:hypothetical protein
MPWPRRRLSLDTLKLQRENDGLKTTIVCLRHELENREGAVGRLEVLMRERSARIDELTGTIDRLREQNKRLDQENEHLVEMVRLPPGAP